MRIKGIYKRIAILIARKRNNRFTAQKKAESEVWTQNENNIDVVDEFKIIEKRITRSKGVSRIGIILLLSIIAACIFLYLTHTWLMYKIGLLDL